MEGKIQNISKSKIENCGQMFLSRPQLNLHKLLNQYYQPKSYLQTPLKEQLQAIAQWVKHYRNDRDEEVAKILKDVGTRVGKLNGKGKRENPGWLVVMKSLMMVHHLMCVGVNGNVVQDTLETIGECLHKLSQTPPHPIPSSLPNQSSHSPIHQKLLTPYHHYLTRRCQMLPKCFTQPSKCHYLINLMNTACACNQAIYLFARYKHFDQFEIMGEFNLVLAKDVTLLYDLLREYLKQGEEEVRRKDVQGQMNAQITENNQLTVVKDIDDILLSLHQQLYHIFYNKYHYLQVERYVPFWIDLDSHYSLKSLKIIKTTKKSSHTYVKSHNLQDTATTLTCSQKNIDMQKVERSLELIDDMEKFLETFDHVVV